MRRTSPLLALLLILAACGTADTGGDATSTTTSTPVTTTGPDTTTTAESGFPVTVEDDLGSVTIDQRPESIVSLSTVATEILFAIGAGEQVVAVDDQSNYPEGAPTTDLSGFTPNVEAILSYEPDLVFISYDPGDLASSLQAAGVPVINFEAAAEISGTYHQIEATGAATGNTDGAADVNQSIMTGLEEAFSEAPDLPDGITYFHEIDSTLYTVTSDTYFGEIYSEFGLENIADAAGGDGPGGEYPQLSSEFVVSADPDLIFLADSLYGESPETVAARPGWDVLTAVQEDHVYGLDSDIASRWGPRVVDFAEAVSDALEDFAAGS
jgi:iron complex transport system substrate-binding protein